MTRKRSQVKLRQQTSKSWITKKRVIQFILICLLACIVSIYRFAPGLVLDSDEGEESQQQYSIQYADHLAESWECMQPSSCQNPHLYGAANFSYSPSRGFFPAGCKWKDVIFDNGTRLYQYWSDDDNSWLLQQPTACTLQVCHAILTLDCGLLLTCYLFASARSYLPSVAAGL